VKITKIKISTNHLKVNSDLFFLNCKNLKMVTKNILYDKVSCGVKITVYKKMELIGIRKFSTKETKV